MFAFACCLTWTVFNYSLQSATAQPEPSSVQSCMQVSLTLPLDWSRKGEPASCPLAIFKSQMLGGWLFFLFWFGLFWFFFGKKPVSVTCQTELASPFARKVMYSASVPLVVYMLSEDAGRDL